MEEVASLVVKERSCHLWKVLTLMEELASLVVKERSCHLWKVLTLMEELFSRLLVDSYSIYVGT
jgi:hypothetical protein